ncbi:MAG: 2-isopropylmalate synthase [Oscillospiraceae bacterium]|jgi:2-isopropylmalate synthase|nr:2-isopropylmalate synthase [Oscillospiraceae bacterium]
MPRTVKIFDTTLRDGEQSPGCSMNTGEKLEIARALERLRVDVIEAGFAASSPGDKEAIGEIAKIIKDCSVASLCRCREGDIDAARDALANAAQPCIHVFLATSDLHMEKKLRMTREQVIENTGSAVRYAKKFCSDVQFSAEDASRSDPDFLCRVFEAAIRAGAATINIPDTVGYALPEETAALVRYVLEHCEGARGVAIAVHPHNDLGMATANVLAGIAAGASQAEVTLCGIGERAGNAALEEVVMGLSTRRNLLDIDCRVETKQIYRSARLLLSTIGASASPNKPVIGQNAFAHEAGIHQHGVMADRATYEIMSPESIGIPQKEMVLGKHSGRHAFDETVQSLGFSLSEEELKAAFKAFKALADKKKNVTNNDIEALIKDGGRETEGYYRLESFVINSGNTIDGTAILKLTVGDGQKQTVAFGDGPVDASFKAINMLAGDFALTSYSLNAITDGGDALGEALVRIENEKGQYTGRGLSTDIIEASIKAYLNAVNKSL